MPTNLNDYLPPCEVGSLLAPPEPIKIDIGERDFRGTVSQFVEKYMTVDGKPFSFARRNYLKPIYDDSFPFSKRTILKCGRQTEKSTCLSMKQLAHVTVIPWFKTLYVSPSQMQTRQFSNDRVRSTAERSPVVKRLFEGKVVSDQVFDKKLLNGSSMYFRYAFLHPDRCRGITADMLNIDEIQDILTDSIPVIRECLSHSAYKMECYSGTPKTTSNAIEFYWEKSTQNEWLPKCRSCGYWNYLDMSVIGPKSLICSKCKGPLYPIDGQWVQMNDGGNWEGFRIPQLMVPWVSFAEIQQKQKDYSTAKFHNEVLGLPYDSGVKPLTEAQLRACCTYGPLVQDPGDRIHGYPTFAGLDWGSGEGETPSWTVLSLGAFVKPPIFTIFFMKRFTGPEADLIRQVGVIGQIIRAFEFRLLGADWGYGHYQNMQLRDAWGVERIAEFEYTTQQLPVKYEPANWRYKIDRTTIMSNFFHEITQQKIQFFDWEQFKTFGQDFLNIDCEYSDNRNKMMYIHSPDRPDDSFHSALYCWLTALAYYKKLPGG